MPDTAGSAEGNSGSGGPGPRNSRTVMVSQFAEERKQSYCLSLPIIPPYFKEQKEAVNDLGLLIKDYYMTKDLCKVLKIRPDTLRSRFRSGRYPEPQRLGDKRIFSLSEVIEIINLERLSIQHQS